MLASHRKSHLCECGIETRGQAARGDQHARRLCRERARGRSRALSSRQRGLPCELRSFPIESEEKLFFKLPKSWLLFIWNVCLIIEGVLMQPLSAEWLSCWQPGQLFGRSRSPSFNQTRLHLCFGRGTKRKLHDRARGTKAAEGHRRGHHSSSHRPTRIRRDVTTSRFRRETQFVCAAIFESAPVLCFRE